MLQYGLVLRWLLGVTLDIRCLHAFFELVGALDQGSRRIWLLDRSQFRPGDVDRQSRLKQLLIFASLEGSAHPNGTDQHSLLFALYSQTVSQLELNAVAEIRCGV